MGGQEGIKERWSYDNSFSCESVTFPTRSLNVNGAPRAIIIMYINAI